MRIHNRQHVERRNLQLLTSHPRRIASTFRVRSGPFTIDANEKKNETSVRISWTIIYLVTTDKSNEQDLYKKAQTKISSTNYNHSKILANDIWYTKTRRHKKTEMEEALERALEGVEGEHKSWSVQIFLLLVPSSFNVPHTKHTPGDPFFFLKTEPVVA